MIETLKYRIKSGSMSNLSNIGTSVPRTSFSAIVSGGTMTGRNMGTVQRKALAKSSRLGNTVEEDDFKVRKIIKNNTNFTNLIFRSAKSKMGNVPCDHLEVLEEILKCYLEVL